MVMSMAATYPHPADGAPIRQVRIAWTSATDGTASGTAYVYGEIYKAVTIPSGTAAPTADYDITLTDSDGLNILGLCDDNLTDRHTSNVEEVYFHLLNAAALAIWTGVVVAGPITVAVANAGNTKSGTLVLYVRGSGC